MTPTARRWLLATLLAAPSGCLTDVEVGGGASADGANTTSGDASDCDTPNDCEDDCVPDCDSELETCNGGSCACRLGLVACAGACVDTMTDPAHCGGCGRSCGADRCLDGVCVAECGTEGDTVSCGGACVDIESHPLHCGDCGERCEANEACSGRQCVEITALDCIGDEQCPAGSRCCESSFFDARVCVEADECS